MTNNKFLKQLINAIQDENTSIAEDATSSAEFTGYLDTGALLFNAAISGSMFGGIPNTKKLFLAGEESVGKTFFALAICKHFLEANPEAVVVWYLAEAAVTKKMLVDRGIDTTRFIMAEVITVQDFRYHVIKTLDSYMEIKNRGPLLLVLDSLGVLSTTKEIEDSTEGKETQDMTRARLIKGVFRILEQKLARSKVPMIITNHTYKEMGLFPKTQMSGGSGGKYASDITAFLSKGKEKEGTGLKTTVTGDIVHITMAKNRFAKPFTKVNVLLSYEKGLDPYYGLADYAVKAGLFEKAAQGYVVDDQKVSTKEMNSNPETYLTAEVLTKLDEYIKTIFEYGSGGTAVEIEEETADAE